MCELRSRLSAIGYRLSAGHPRQFLPTADSRQPTARRGFTLVEMLVAMAITLVMMAAVVTLFANVSNSVRNRRATIEMSSQLRHVRNVLQQDLQGATCPGVTWQRPESNHGYIEIIEGQYREGDASNLLDADPNNPGTPPTWPPTTKTPEIDHVASILPASNLPFRDPAWVTDGAGLGDYDDVLMLTVRNEHEPFVGRVPTNVRRDANRAYAFASSDPDEGWKYGTIESPLAEVVWFAVENPGYTADPASGASDPSAGGFFGEPGMRTIYRRALLIAPWVNPYRFVEANGTIRDAFTLDGESVEFQARPGLVRVLIDDIARDDLHQALACLVAFQERYDLSVRLEFDPNLDPPNGRYVILANTLGDLTKRENRYEHYSFRPEEGSVEASRDYPYAAASMGSGYEGSNPPVICWPDPESPSGPPDNFQATSDDEGVAELQDVGTLEDVVIAYRLGTPFPPPGAANRNRYKWRPFAYVDGDSDTIATARVMLNDNGEVVRIIHGLVPLSRERRGEDVMMTNVLAFDLRVYDPGALLFATVSVPGLPLTDPNQSLDVVLSPSDPGWKAAIEHENNMDLNAGWTGLVGRDNSDSDVVFPYVGQGAYVDMGYGHPHGQYGFATAFQSSTPAWFYFARPLSDVYGDALAPGYAVYDTWSFHYENNGVNEDEFWFDGTDWQPASAHPDPNQQWRQLVDTGVDGLDNSGMLGVDDIGERETAPPYDKPLRGVQVLIRTYETDSRSIRQVRVNQHFLPE